MRVFVGIPLSNEARREVEKLYKFLKRRHWKVKWEPVEKVHLTLIFLGNVENGGDSIGPIKSDLQNDNSNNLQSIKVAVKGACESLQLIKVNFKSLGCFPDYDWPRIIWLGLKGDLKSLSVLQKLIKENLTKAGFKFADKPFAAHLTLGRIKRARARERREIGRQIKKMRETSFKSKWVVDRVVVWESKLLRKGSEYFELFSAEF